METRFVKDYIDGITFSNLNNEDRELLKKCGYTEDKQGEVYAIFKFGDGIAYVPNHCGLVLRYPTLYEVSQSEKMQREIAAYTCRPDITPYDIALKYGRLGKYKYVLNYNEWIAEGDNDLKEIWCLNKHVVQGDEHAMDVFEEEFIVMDDKGLISCKEDEDGYYVGGSPTAAELENLQAAYGILWTEWVGTHIYNERGFLEEVA